MSEDRLTNLYNTVHMNQTQINFNSDNQNELGTVLLNIRNVPSIKETLYNFWFVRLNECINAATLHLINRPASIYRDHQEDEVILRLLGVMCRSILYGSVQEGGEVGGTMELHIV